MSDLNQPGIQLGATIALGTTLRLIEASPVWPLSAPTEHGGKVMSNSLSAREIPFQFPWGRAVGRDPSGTQQEALRAELRAALAREEVLRGEKRDLSEHHAILTQESEHRLLNGLQLIAGLLSLQSRTIAKTPEAAFLLASAARRVIALGRVNHQLHAYDHLKNVELKQFLVSLCEDLSDVLFEERTDHTIVVEGVGVEIPAALAAPLGFIVNELITNSVKYAKSDIIVRIENAVPACYSLSVQDEGPGLPAGFDATKWKGLGMKLVVSLVKKIGGELQIVPRNNGSAARFTVLFRCPQFENGGTQSGAA
jgi:two-component system, sensor histidine kinase PdtaS